ncbi:MAG: 2-alkenal reductase [Nitratiruptor sp.]|nr:2-alkenal reductase [Nitratiruptor sp.]NPA83945.1 PDZ domain-containing protein [Campylobacterota bacterium]
MQRILLLLAGMMVGLLLYQALPLLETWIASKPRAITPRGALMELEETNIAIFERAKPSVVYISTLQEVVDYWGRRSFNVPKGTGSGFVWDRFGHIVTNYHVIEGASEAIVTLANGLGYRARLVGADPRRDLAVLKIDPVPGVMEPVVLGSSHDLKVGQIVYAIGNPFGLDWTMTMGIISALDRVIEEENGAQIEGAIQTDAAINPGNSGGPLLDSAGRVIGVNTAIYSPSGASAGIGFAIPIDLVNMVVSSIIARKGSLLVDLGIISDDRINRLLQRRFQMEGVAVLALQPNSPAWRLGLRPTRIYPDGRVQLGDVVVAVNGRRVSSYEELLELLYSRAPGAPIELEVLRDGTIVRMEVRLEGG